MDFNEEIYEKIQQYLDMELEGEALQAFEAAINANPALASEVALHREMEDFLADTPENDLRKNLQTLNERFNEDSDKLGANWRFLFLLLPFLLVSGWWLISNNSSVLTDKKIKMESSRQSTPNQLLKTSSKPETPTDTLSSSETILSPDTTQLVNEKEPIAPIIKETNKENEKSKTKQAPSIVEPQSPLPDSNPDTILAPDTPSMKLFFEEPVANIPSFEPTNQQSQLSELLEVPIDPHTNQAYKIFEFDTIIYATVDETGYKPQDTLIIKGDPSTSNYILSKIDTLVKKNNWVLMKEFTGMAGTYKYIGDYNLDTFFEKFTRPDFQHEYYKIKIDKSVDLSISSTKDSISLHLTGDFQNIDTSPVLVRPGLNLQIFPSGIAEYIPLDDDVIDLDCIDWYTCQFDFQKDYLLKPGNYYLVITPLGRSNDDIIFVQKFTLSE